MALWIIAIVLVIVFFPILASVAFMAAGVALVGIVFAMGIGGLVFLFYYAGRAAANPSLAQKVGLAVMAAYILLCLPPVSRAVLGTLNPVISIGLKALLSCYGACLLLIYRNRGLQNGGGLGLALAFAGSLLAVAGVFLFISSSGALSLLIGTAGSLIAAAGYLILVLAPAHPDTPAQAALGVKLVAWGMILENLQDILSDFLSCFQVSMFPSTALFYLSLLVMAAGLAVYTGGILPAKEPKQS